MVPSDHRTQETQDGGVIQYYGGLTVWTWPDASIAFLPTFDSPFGALPRSEAAPRRD
jgi:hypothetical protein